MENGSKIKIKNYTKTCFACPAQWECLTDDGKYVYIRYRNGYLRAGIADSEEKFWNQDNKESIYNIFNELIGEESDGFMEFDEMSLMLKDKLDFSGAIENFE